MSKNGVFYRFSQRGRHVQPIILLFGNFRANENRIIKNIQPLFFFENENTYL